MSAPARSTPWTSVALLGLLTVQAVGLGDESVGVAVALLIVVALLWLMWKAPLSVSVVLLVFVGLVLESPDQRPAGGAWESPLYTLGAVMLAHLNVTTGIDALFFSGIDLLIAFLFLVMVYRKLAHARVHDERRLAASPICAFAWLSLLGTFAWWSYGVASGGNLPNAMWQVNKLYYLPLAVLLVEAAFRDAEDHRLLGRAVVLAACVKACLAIWIRWIATHGEIPYATTHADSILFACAICFIVALCLEKQARGRRALLLFVLSLLLAGMIANNRRLVWVGVAWPLATYYLITPWTVRKRALTRAGLLSLPLVAAYLALGWTSGSRVFAPARLVGSIVSSDSDGSTVWRDLENFNLVYNVTENPLLGTGFGHEYVERVRLPDVSTGFALYRYLPHNGVLGLWVFCGYFGFAAQWLLLVVGMFLATRTYRRAGRPIDRAAALCSIAAILIYIVSAYGDTTLGAWSGVFTAGPALAASGNLAVATGAWPAKRKSAVPVRVARLGPEGRPFVRPSEGRS